MIIEKITRNSVFSNLLWRFAERSGAQFVSFITTIIIARILEPEAYGLTAIISVFTTILFVFVDSGLGSSLVQKKNVDDLDYSTVFWTNIILCTILYIILFFCSPLIASFYDNLQMIDLLRVSGIMLILSSIKNVQQAYISRNLLFQKFFFATLLGTIVSAIVGIGMAVTGFGVWALVISGLSNSMVDIIVLWFTVKWRPKVIFSFERLKGLFWFGSKILAANIFQCIYSNIYQLIIGKKYLSADLAFYNRGQTIPQLIVSNVDDSINSVLFPVMSKGQSDKENIKSITKRALKTNMYIMTPILFGLAAIAEPFIFILLTNKWEEAIIYMQIFCVIYALRPISTANLSALKALGCSNIFFKLEVIKDILGVIVLMITVRMGVLAIILGVLFVSIICQFINAWPSKKVFGYGIQEQICDIFPILLIGCIMGSCVFQIKHLELNEWMTLLIQIPIGIGIYTGGSYLLKIDSFFYTKNLIIDGIKNRERRINK